MRFNNMYANNLANVFDSLAVCKKTSWNPKFTSLQTTSILFVPRMGLNRENEDYSD